MAASYLERTMNHLRAVRAPPASGKGLVAGRRARPVLRMVAEMRFGDAELSYRETIGFRQALLRFLEEFRFSGEIDAIPEGTVAFAGEPLVRVTGPRIEAQLLETLLLNQINFQTAIATKAARVVLAAGGGKPGAGEKVIDFSPRRDHGIDAAMKAARAAAIAGVVGTSNVAAAMRYGMRPVGTMAHSYVMSFADEREAFRTFMEDSLKTQSCSSTLRHRRRCPSRDRGLAPGRRVAHGFAKLSRGGWCPTQSAIRSSCCASGAGDRVRVRVAS